jgi:hypothetical protein
LLCCALICALSLNAAAAIQLRIIEGDGTTYPTGARATRGVTVLVSDETGQPVDHAIVTFRLPDQGPSGVFNSGSRSQAVTTGADGRATVWGMQWNKAAGPVEIRITAVKDQAHAGIIATEYLNATVVSDPDELHAGGQGVFAAPHKGHGKYLLIGILVGGAAAAGMMFARSQGTKTNSAPTPGITIGTPSVIVGQHP